MDQIVASVDSKNTEGRSVAARDFLDESTIRRTTVEGVVDTGSVMLVLPENVGSQLGLAFGHLGRMFMMVGLAATYIHQKIVGGFLNGTTQ